MDNKPRRNEPIVDPNGVASNQFSHFLEGLPSTAEPVDDLVSPITPEGIKINELMATLRNAGVLKDA